MNRDDFEVAVAAMNGRPQRLVTVDRTDGTGFRDQINADSAIARKRFIKRAAGKFLVEEQELGWLDDAIVTAADVADAQADAQATEGDREERRSQATQLVELAVAVELFHDPDGEAFARFVVDEHYEVAAVRNKHFRRWLARMFYLDAGKASSSQAMQDAIGVLEGKAIFEGRQRTVHVRIAEHEGKIYVDLCNREWQVVEVSAAGWQVLGESPVMFRRAKAMLPLPSPERGGTVNELRRFVHLADDEWTLFLSWLVAALRPTGPYPILDVLGEHGTGKSTLCRMARALVDPNTAMVRSEPREPRDLMIASKNGWIIALDNLSRIQAWQSDCLCRLSTGGGFSTRMLFQDDEEVIFDAQRPVIINGIDDVATRADLLDRCLLLIVPRMEQVQRRTEVELWASFEAARPRILGALLSAVVSALRNIEGTILPVLPRMADFAIWATAAEPAFGLPSGQFIAAYQSNRTAGNEVALEASPVGKVVMEFIAAVGSWSGTATELLKELEPRLDQQVSRLKSWPTSARSLGSAIRRLAPNLRDAGVGVEFGRTGQKGARTITLTHQPEQLENLSSAMSATSATSIRLEFCGSDAAASADANLAADANGLVPSSAEIDMFSENNAAADATDDADAGIPFQSLEPDWTEV